jgi:hypothetical protein
VTAPIGPDGSVGAVFHLKSYFILKHRWRRQRHRDRCAIIADLWRGLLGLVLGPIGFLRAGFAPVQAQQFFD